MSVVSYGVESSPAAALAQQQRNEAQLADFHRQLDLLCNEKAQSEHREEQLLSIFAHLRQCPAALQLDLLDLLAHLLERRPSLITGCRNLLPLTIRFLTDLVHSSPPSLFDPPDPSSTPLPSSPSSSPHPPSSSDLYTSILMRLFFLIGTVGKETITVRDVNRLFHLFQLTVERKAPPLLCRLLLSALNDMAGQHDNKALQAQGNSVLSPMAQAAQSRAGGASAFTFTSSAPSFPPPSAFFEFQGPQPALVIPPMEHWPCPKAYTICMWIRWDHSDRRISTAHPTQLPVAQTSFFGARRPPPPPAGPSFTPTFSYLYSLLTSKARGIEACIEQHTRKLHLRSAGKSAMVESNTEVIIPTHTWLLLSIIHSRPKTFSRSTGTVTVMVNEDVRHEGELTYPQVTEPMVSSSIGANITNIRPYTAFNGRLGSLYFFSRALAPAQVALLARKGSDFPMNTLVVGEKANLLKSLVLTGVNALLNPFNMFGQQPTQSGYESSKTSTPTVDSSMYRETFRHLILLYHPKCVENEQMVVDTSHVYTKIRSGLNATMAAGVEACVVNNVREVVHCLIGGVRSLFPIIYYIDSLSPPLTAATKGRSSASLLPLAITTLTVVLRDNASNQKEMLSCNGMAVLGHLLRHTPPHHLNEHLLTSIEELVQYTSWLVTASRTPPDEEAGGGGKGEAGASDAKAKPTSPGGATDWVATLTEGQWIPGMSNVALPLSAAGDRSLFNDLFLHVLLNLSLWTKCDYAVQADVVRMVRSHVSKQAKYFRRMIHPTVILDRMRRMLSYEDAIQAEMIKDIKAREQHQQQQQHTGAAAGAGGGGMESAKGSAVSSPALTSSASFTTLPPITIPSSSPLPPPPAGAEPSARDSAIALRLRQLRNLRAEWLIVVKDMMLADISRRAMASDIFALVQMCCDMTDPLQIAEVLELLTALSFAHPDIVHPLLSRCGGATLFITILQRYSHHVHVQVAAFHLLSVMLRGLPVDVKPDVLQQLSAIFLTIEDLMTPHPFTLTAYHALMEMVLGLAPGALGVKNGAEFSVDHYFKQCYQPAPGDAPLAGGATSPAYSRPTSPRGGGGAGFAFPVSPASASSFSSMSFARQCTIRFPIGLEVMFALCKKDRDMAEEDGRREAERRRTAAASPTPPAAAVGLTASSSFSGSASQQQPESPSASASLPSSSQSFPVISPSHISRTVSPMSMSQLLLDVDYLLSASPSQCAVILNRWPAWPMPLIAQLDWQAAPIEPPHTPSHQSRASTTQPPPPTDAFGLFNSSPTAASKPSKGFFDLDSFTSGSATDSLDSQLDLFSQGAREDVFASLIPSSSASSLASSSQPAAAEASAAVETVPQLSSRILESLLYHALVHVKDGWVHWRDTLMFLRTTASHSAIPDPHFRAVRRDLFVGLLQRLGQLSSNDLMTSGVVTGELKVNLAHIIDIMEELLFFEEVKKTGKLRIEEVDTRRGGGGEVTQSMPSSSSPEPSSSLSGSAEEEEKADHWMVVTEEDAADLLGPPPTLVTSASASSSTSSSTSPLPLSPSFTAPSGASTSTPDHIRLIRQEWVLINELLSTIISLSFPLTPHRQLSQRPESNSFFDALKSDGEGPQPVRAGGPLRVVLRFLLDCVASVIASVNFEREGGVEEGGGERGPPVKQLERMFASLATICTRDLNPQPSAGAQRREGDKGAERTWKNRYGLVVLSRLSSMTRSAPPSLHPALLTGCRQLVDILQPFSLVSALNFIPGRENSDGQDRVIYVPVMVNATGQLDISPSFNFQLSSSASEVPGASTPASLSGGGGGSGGGMGADLLAAHRRVQDSMNSGAQARLDGADGWGGGSSGAGDRPNMSGDDVFFGAASPLPSQSFSSPTSSATSPRSIASMYPSSFIDPHSSSSYSKVLRGCMDYVHSCVKLVTAAESRYAAEYNVLMEKTRHYVTARLRTEREGWRSLGEDLLRAAARVLQSHQYTEANRKAVVDALAREQQREVAELWRSFQWSLFVEGSAWIPASMIGKRRYWQIDPFEQHENRMRRKLKQFHDGTDLKQASQSYLQELERVKQQKISKAAVAASTASKKKRAAGSGVGKNLAMPLELGAEGEVEDRKELEADGKGVGPGLGEAIEALETEALQDGGEEDIEKMRSLVSNLGDQLHLNLKAGGAEEEKEATEVEYADDAAEAEDAAAAGAELQSPVPVAGEGEEETGGADGEGKEEASTTDADWDLCTDNPELNRPVLSTNANSYTSLNVMMVLSFTTVMGSLEMGSRYLQFVPNLNAEMTDRNGNAVYEKGGEGRRVWTLPGLDAQRKRAKKTRQWELRDVLAIYRRRFQLQKTALEVFLSNGRNFFLDFGSREERRLVLAKLLSLKPPRLQRWFSRPAVELMSRSKLTQRWQKREISNFEYLMHLNTISGRTYNDLNQYPVFPWVLSYFPSKGEEDPDVNLIHVINSDASHPQAPLIFRDLRKPIGALNPKRLEQILERYHSFQDDKIPSFMYGSHFSNAGIIMYYLLRFEPYASLHVEFQAGKFDFPDRLFYSIGQTWKTCLNSLSCYKELTPELFYQPSILDNTNGYDLGVKQDGEVVNHVVLPSWAADSAEFIRIHRLALESEYVSAHLHHWVDLIFGYKQRGKAAIDAHNVFFHLTYEGAVDLSTITDPVLKNAVKDQISLFGQTPLQLFKKPHPARGPPVINRLEKLRLANPQFHAALQQPHYQHAHVKRMVLADRSSVVAISCVNAKLFTVSAKFTVALHWWQPYQSDDYAERKADGSIKRVHLPFTHALAAVDHIDKQSAISPQHVLFSWDGKLLFEVNNWDDSLRVYSVQSAINTEQLKLGLKDKSATFGSLSCILMQHLRQHKGRITCISLGRDERTLVTGSTDCTLLVWQLESEEAANKIAGLLQETKTYVKSEPRHRLRGHEDEVVAVAVQSELDVCVSVSARGLVLLHSLRKGWFLLRIRVPTAQELRAAAIAAAASPDTAPSEQVGTEELVRGQGDVDQPLQVDYGLDDFGGRDTIVSMRKQLQSTSPRSSQSSASPPPWSTSSSSSSPSPSPPLSSSLLHLPSLVRFTVEGHMVFFSRTWDVVSHCYLHSQLSVCGVNGRNWRVLLVDEDVSCMAVNAEGKLLVVGGVRGGVCIRRVHDLKVIQRFEPCSSQVASIAFSAEQEYIFVSTVQGELSILVVHC